MAPTNKPWGLRPHAIDLEGHQWEFSQLLRVVEPEAWRAMRIEEQNRPKLGNTL